MKYLRHVLMSVVVFAAGVTASNVRFVVEADDGRAKRL